ncbi:MULTISPECIES: PadR family transcriptional regulator [Clostridium]|uniref:Transcriptional regulator, PadR-like family n=2 Tax=Clostridium TaxID=1485 RepID=A0A0E3GPZ0_CLOSL|nr:MULTISPECIES: PadR family transcriptional regulator [Clostridium]AKA67656.1 transcriptional regulator, PadR-like family [Clostridium scatologenes]AWI05918.1 hypothetical protein B9W14_15880 [Clostridium drakei]
MKLYKKCSCEGGNLDKFVQPIILKILYECDAYGYVILKKIAESPMMKGAKPDPTGIYRQLKTMEERGLLMSKEQISDNGNLVKCYSITESGKQCLLNWIRTLKDYRDSIDLLLVEIQKTIK